MSDEKKGSILDVHSGSYVGTFPGGQDGFAVSTDGKQMAIGNGRSVEIYSIE